MHADPSVGWSNRSAASANAGFGHAPNAHMYDQSLNASADNASIKAKLVNLISATRTLMRSESSRQRGKKRAHSAVPLIVVNVAM